jgi:hypothetical protein
VNPEGWVTESSSEEGGEEVGGLLMNYSKVVKVTEKVEGS